jgi:protein arginine kinase
VKFSALIKRRADWMEVTGPNGDIVITSRVRLARNVESVPFPGWARKDDRVKILEELQEKVGEIEPMKGAFSEELSKLTPIKKQVLVERHLISREHAAKGAGSAAVMNPGQTLSVMINEEDHLRMQSILPGLDLRHAFETLDAVDSALEKKVRYAFDSRFGFLTACPTNLGTGMRASAMLHLPGLMLSDQINQIVQAVNKIGLAVRGLYGEGTEALANLFQVSNQHTLGEREEEIIARLEKVILQIINHERNARKKLQQDAPEKLMDHIGRAYATLRFAHVIESKEALNHLSMLRLGLDMNSLPLKWATQVDSLLMEIQPAHLQIRAKGKLSAAERDTLRAEILRSQLKTLPEPDTFTREEGDPSGQDESQAPESELDDE